ncbi:MAG: oxaloacetate-decarboxylating malate dehydrogenase [Acidobacteria bacterium]|nr:oxaloacetate-decarboxylating malate dehydrogenase [Acidobacteriota bacterium]
MRSRRGDGPNDPVRLPVDGILDLHAFRPSEAGDLVREYLEECRRRGILEIRIVHGKGRGALRRTVHAALDRIEGIERYRLAGDASGWGATLVTLEPAGRVAEAGMKQRTRDPGRPAAGERENTPMGDDRKTKTTAKGTFPTGADLLHEPTLNKGTAFTEAERDAFGLRGLLPPRVCTQDVQVQRVMQNYRQKSTDLERFIHMVSLQDRNETLFYRFVIDNLEELMPIIYTPVVGLACQQFGQIFRRSRGLFVTAEDRGRVKQVLRNWPHQDVRVIVVTDGQRILGLGDLGANGMGIPIGKLSLYTACAGVHPNHNLPVCLDVGTNNERLLDDPLYLGLRRRRLEGPDYDALVDEFVEAAHDLFHHPLIQFEDFANQNSFRLLQRYRDRICTFNDDIQGTAGVILAGIYSAMRITGGKLKDQKVLYLGGGSAGVGIADLIVTAMREEGMPEAEARRRHWLIDSKGLVVKSRDNLQAHKLAYAHEGEFLPDLLSAVGKIKPTILIGVSGQPRTFTREVVEAMARINDRPVIFALSNPTSKSECAAEEAYTWTSGRAIFASGSPFPPVTIGGKRFVPGQGNNAYVFPGVGLGAAVCGARTITGEVFAAAAEALAREVTPTEIELGCIYPPLKKLRQVSAAIAAAVAEVAYRRDLATRPRPGDLLAHVRSQQYEPAYQSYL